MKRNDIITKGKHGPENKKAYDAGHKIGYTDHTPKFKTVHRKNPHEKDSGDWHAWEAGYNSGDKDYIDRKEFHGVTFWDND